MIKHRETIFLIEKFKDLQSLNLYYKVTWYIKWAKTSWTFSMMWRRSCAGRGGRSRLARRRSTTPHLLLPGSGGEFVSLMGFSFWWWPGNFPPDGTGPTFILVAEKYFGFLFIISPFPFFRPIFIKFSSTMKSYKLQSNIVFMNYFFPLLLSFLFPFPPSLIFFSLTLPSFHSGPAVLFLQNMNPITTRN